MIGIWGYKIAKKPTSKGFRSAYRSLSKKCTIYDSSFLNCLELRASERRQIISVVQSFCDPSDFAINAEMYKDGTRRGEMVLYTPNSFPFGCIGPVEFLWKVTEEGKESFLWIWVHPSFLSFLISLMDPLCEREGVKMELLEGQLQKFELRGPSALQVLAKVLQASSEQEIQVEGSKVWQVLKYVRGTCPLKGGTVLALNVKDPRTNFPPTQEVTFQGDFESLSSLVNKLAVAWPSSASFSCLWDSHKRNQFFRKKLVPSEFELNTQRANVNKSLL